MGEGEYNIGMNILFATKFKISPPPFPVFEMGEAGRGSNA